MSNIYYTINMKEIKYFTLNGKTPYQDWYNGLEKNEKYTVDYAVISLAKGLTGKAKSLKGGLWELRLHISSGLRVYFAYEGATLLILLCGGDKSTQKKDIKNARTFWDIWRIQNDQI